LAKTQQLPEGIKLPTPEEFAAFEEMIKKATGEKPGGKKTETKVPEKKRRTRTRQSFRTRRDRRNRRARRTR
jgi:hypothetical protein